MKKNLLTPLYLVAVIAIIGMSWSCTRENASAPAPQTNISDNEDILQAGEVSSAVVVPGIYSILKFIDTGDDITTDYTGYTFEFKSDGTLVATTDLGAVFTGTWKENQAQTKMAINIHGNAKLNNLSDDSWKVVLISNHRISLKKAGPDKVIFVM
jgi:hypothetical protein